MKVKELKDIKTNISNSIYETKSLLIKSEYEIMELQEYNGFSNEHVSRLVNLGELILKTRKELLELNVTKDLILSCLKFIEEEGGEVPDIYTDILLKYQEDKFI